MNTILYAAFAATTVMTAFGYLVSYAFGKLYKEPALLQFVMKQLNLGMPGYSIQIIAWCAHYLIGLLFVIAFDVVSDALPTKISYAAGLVFGTVIGTIGILGWAVAFKFVGTPRKTKGPGYYAQLFMAHLLFAFTVITVYRIM